jgi:competence protein ComEC
MQSVVFYILMLGLAGGVLLRSFLFISPPVLLLGLVMALGLAVLWQQRGRFHTKVATGAQGTEQVLLYIVVLITAIVFGALRFGVAEDTVMNNGLATLAGEEVTIIGTVVAEPDVRATSMLLTVAVEDTRVLVRTDRYSDIAYGDKLEITGQLEVPEAFTTDLGRAFDYPGYLYARGITHTMSFVTPVVVERGEGNPLINLYEAKSYFLSQLALVITEPAVALGAGLLLGVQSALGDDLEEAFRTSGIIHIVVLSGYNIMLVVAFVMYVFAYFLPFRARLICGIGAVILFALLVGYAPSVLRASLMAILFLVASLMARPYLILRMLILAGVLMIMWNPYILRYDIGFQLSFMATLGLILVAPHLEMAFTHVSTWFSLRSFLVATMATQVAVAPLLLYHIGEWSLVAVPVNLLVLPMVPVAMLLTFLTGLLAMVSVVLATPFGALAELSLLYIIKAAELAAAIPFAAVAIPPFPGYLVPLSYIFLGLLWYRFFYRRSQTPALPLVGDSHATAVQHWTIVTESEVPTSPSAIRKTKANETVVPLASSTADEKSVQLPIFFR